MDFSISLRMHRLAPGVHAWPFADFTEGWKNMGGMRFQDVTDAAGVRRTNLVARGAVFADINGDGWLDLLVSTLGQGVVCFLNDGHGKFIDATQSAGAASHLGSVTMALADVDGNGTLDLYIANYRSEDIRDRGQVDLLMVKGQMVVPPKLKDRFLVVGNQVIEYAKLKHEPAPPGFRRADGVGGRSPGLHFTTATALGTEIRGDAGGKSGVVGREGPALGSSPT